MNEYSEKDARLNALRQLLRNTDYKAAKYAEGWYSDGEYAEMRSLRQAWREEINALEEEIEQDPND